jgi:hypothetical protein
VFIPGAITCPSTPGLFCNGVFIPGAITCPSTGPAFAPGNVTFAPGWNIVGGPNGTVINGNVGPLYTFGPGSTAYQIVPPGTPLQAGVGYWAYFSVPTQAVILSASSNVTTVSLPAAQYVLIGNPGNTTATISGVDVMYIWNGSSYQPATQLQPGWGAWVFAWSGGLAQITSAPF